MSEQAITENKTRGDRILVFCARCNTDTRHIVLQSVDNEGSSLDDDGAYAVNWSNNYQIIQCQGCEMISFRHRNWFSEYMDDDPYTGKLVDDGTRELLFPKRSKNYVHAKDLYNVPVPLRRIYHETVECFNEENYTLCAGGLRAIVEGICSDHKITVQKLKPNGSYKLIRRPGLNDKIDGLYKIGILTKKDTEILHEHKFLGDDALHELNQPGRDELGLAINIIEHMLESIYEIPEKADLLRYKRSRRTEK